MAQDINSFEKIEILSLDLFDTHQEEISIVEKYQKYFNADLGWHYYLDLAWIIREISALPKGSLLLDAGAGSGLLQFILADLGYNVISVDFLERSFSSKHLQRYEHRIRHLNKKGSQTFDNCYTRHLRSSADKRNKVPFAGLKQLLTLTALRKFLADLMDRNPFVTRHDTDMDTILNNAGNISLYNCDLKKMSLLPDGIFDGVVSVSALEHNDFDDLEKCCGEILRVTKQSGRLLITVSASQGEDWFHEPSKGWCYSEETIKKYFQLPDDVKTNFSQKDILFRKITKEGNQLHQRLAPVYFKSGDNGMPWGKWNPQYQPVGISKIRI